MTIFGLFDPSRRLITLRGRDLHTGAVSLWADNFYLGEAAADSLGRGIEVLPGPLIAEPRLVTAEWLDGGHRAIGHVWTTLPLAVGTGYSLKLARALPQAPIAIVQVATSTADLARVSRLIAAALTLDLEAFDGGMAIVVVPPGGTAGRFQSCPPAGIEAIHVVEAELDNPAAVARTIGELLDTEPASLLVPADRRAMAALIRIDPICPRLALGQGASAPGFEIVLDTRHNRPLGIDATVGSRLVVAFDRRDEGERNGVTRLVQTWLSGPSRAPSPKESQALASLARTLNALPPSPKSGPPLILLDDGGSVPAFLSALEMPVAICPLRRSGAGQTQKARIVGRFESASLGARRTVYAGLDRDLDGLFARLCAVAGTEYHSIFRRAIPDRASMLAKRSSARAE
jgi:hypothetical protein